MKPKGKNERKKEYILFAYFRLLLFDQAFYTTCCYCRLLSRRRCRRSFVIVVGYYVCVCVFVYDLIALKSKFIMTFV